MTDDLVARLRREGESAFHKHYSLGMWKLCAEAADEIDRLNRKLDQADRIVDRLQCEKTDAEDNNAALERYYRRRGLEG